MSERDDDVEFKDSESIIQSAFIQFENNRQRPTGYCHWCQEKTDGEDDIYCCPECGQDHERFKKANLKM